MLGTIYIGMAGMNAYTKGLDIISNNVANLNTVGFKAGVASFMEVVNRNNSGATFGSAGTTSDGGGVTVNADGQDFRKGDARDSDSPLDTMIDGNGFFVFEHDGQRYYSRAGEFDFDKDGFLIDKQTGYQVMVSTDSSGIGSLQQEQYLVYPPKATTEVKLQGNLTRAATNAPTTAPATITVLDSSGTKHALTIKFTRADGTTVTPPADPTDTSADDAATKLLTWHVDVLDDKQKVLGSGTVKFDADGSPAADNAPISATLTPDSLPPFTFTLNFGTAGSYSGVTSLVDNTTSAVQMLKQDGLALGTVISQDFDERGNLEFKYSNGEKKTLGRLVLARFNSNGDLSSVGNRMYVAQAGKQPRLGGAADSGLGAVKGQALEMSNVQLTDQFSDLIIIQRGYQASSQMTSVANEMLQQLLSMQDKR